MMLAQNCGVELRRQVCVGQPQLPTVHGVLMLSAVPAPAVSYVPFPPPPPRNTVSPDLLLEV